MALFRSNKSHIFRQVVLMKINISEFLDIFFLIRINTIYIENNYKIGFFLQPMTIPDILREKIFSSKAANNNLRLNVVLHTI